MLILTIENVKDYRRKVEVHLLLLPSSKIFTAGEKKELDVIYNKLIAICDTKISASIEVYEPTIL